MMMEFCTSATLLFQAMDEFVQYSRASSDTFLYWDEYSSVLSALLLNYIAAMRSDIKDVEIESFAKMLPYDYMCGHQHYARW